MASQPTIDPNTYLDLIDRMNSLASGQEQANLARIQSITDNANKGHVFDNSNHIQDVLMNGMGTQGAPANPSMDYLSALGLSTPTATPVTPTSGYQQLLNTMASPVQPNPTSGPLEAGANWQEPQNDLQKLLGGVGGFLANNLRTYDMTPSPYGGMAETPSPLLQYMRNMSDTYGTGAFSKNAGEEIKTKAEQVKFSQELMMKLMGEKPSSSLMTKDGHAVDEKMGKFYDAVTKKEVNANELLPINPAISKTDQRYIDPTTKEQFNGQIQANGQIMNVDTQKIVPKAIPYKEPNPSTDANRELRTITLIGKDLDTQQLSRGNFSVSQMVINRAEKTQGLFDMVGDKQGGQWDNRQIREMATAVDSILSGGTGVTGAERIRGLIPNTWGTTASSVKEYITNHPEDAQVQDFANRLMATTLIEKQVAEQQIERTQFKRLGKWEAWRRENPTAWTEAVAGYVDIPKYDAWIKAGRPEIKIKLDFSAIDNMVHKSDSVATPPSPVSTWTPEKEARYQELLKLKGKK